MQTMQKHMVNEEESNEMKIEHTSKSDHPVIQKIYAKNTKWIWNAKLYGTDQEWTERKFHFE